MVRWQQFEEWSLRCQTPWLTRLCPRSWHGCDSFLQLGLGGWKVEFREQKHPEGTCPAPWKRGGPRFWEGLHEPTSQLYRVLPVWSGPWLTFLCSINITLLPLLEREQVSPWTTGWPLCQAFGSFRRVCVRTSSLRSRSWEHLPHAEMQSALWQLKLQAVGLCQRGPFDPALPNPADGRTVSGTSLGMTVTARVSCRARPGATQSRGAGRLGSWHRREVGVSDPHIPSRPSSPVSAASRGSCSSELPGGWEAPKSRICAMLLLVSVQLCGSHLITL